jgi:hypothetical protein
VDERLWWLPGPRSFVRDVAAEQRRGRHVAAVLPEALATDVIFTDSLAVALIDELTSQSVTARRIYPADGARSVLETFAQALIFENQPVTIPDLMNHPEVHDTVAVVVAGDLCGADRRGLAQFLHRVELESHTADSARRLSVVAVLARHQLPRFTGGASSDIALTSIWWWARVARWDVAAHIAGMPERSDLTGVLEDVRAEEVVEIARWDLDLAEHLTATWSGEPTELPPILKDWRAMPALGTDGSRVSMNELRPPDQLLDPWDQRTVDGWHHGYCVAGYLLVAEPERLSQVVWAAQARVLLPWIEERRSGLHARISKALGAKRLAAILLDRFDPPIAEGSLAEIGTLDRVARMCIGSTDTELRDAARRLRDARNSLAHLRPLSLGEQASLLAACQCLL